MKKKKKVCFLNGHIILRNHKTGVHYFQEITTKNLIEKNKKYSINVGLFGCNKESSSLINEKNNKWLKRYLNVSRLPRILSYFIPIELFFGKNDAYFCDGFVPITFFKSKKICVIHDMMSKIYPENYTLIKKIYFNIYFWQIKKADLIVCVSETTKKDIMRFCGIPANKIVVCYNGVDKFRPNPENYQISCKNADIRKKYLFYIGDMRKNKNLVNTVKGFLRFCEKYNVHDLYFYIAGKKNGDFEEIKNIIKKSDFSRKIKFLGYISDNDKTELYANSMCIVLLSLYEGFGMPIIEGMQHNKPVLTSNCSSMKEIAGDTAITVNPMDTEKICDAIFSIYSGKFQVNQKAYSEKLEKFTFENVANIIDKAIESIL